MGLIPLVFRRQKVFLGPQKNWLLYGAYEMASVMASWPVMPLPKMQRKGSSAAERLLWLPESPLHHLVVMASVAIEMIGYCKEEAVALLLKAGWCNMNVVGRCVCVCICV